MSDTPSLAEIRARYAAHGYGALSPEERLRLGLPAHMDGEGGGKSGKGKKRKRALGHFQVGGWVRCEYCMRVRREECTVSGGGIVWACSVQMKY